MSDSEKNKKGNSPKTEEKNKYKQDTCLICNGGCGKTSSRQKSCIQKLVAKELEKLQRNHFQRKVSVNFFSNYKISLTVSYFFPYLPLQLLHIHTGIFYFHH